MAVKRKIDTTESPLIRSDKTQAPSKSSLVHESAEISFPRGGSSALTPLELKQVANEAATDVLFNTSRGQEDKKNLPKKKKAKLAKNASKEGQDANADDDDDDDKIRIQEHVSFKSLPVGSKLLGQISQIKKHALILSLTDNLRGYVPITNVSTQINDLLDNLKGNIEDSKNNEEEQDDESDYESDEDIKEEKDAIIDLTKKFYLGQWLRCQVTKNTALELPSKTKKIELTIEPSVVNEDFETEDYGNKNGAIQCSIKSIEDHGAILDIGNGKLNGFIPNKELPPNATPGLVFLGFVSKSSDRTVTISGRSNPTNVISTISSVDTIVPGQLVDFLVESVRPNHGIFGKVFGLVNGFLNLAHINVKENFQETFSIGTTVKVRIISNILYKGHRVLLVSQLNHLIKLTSFSTALASQQALESFPVGYIFDDIKIVCNDDQYIYAKINDQYWGQIHHSKYEKEDSKKRARVLGFNEVDQYYILTTKKADLEIEYLSSKDIPIGELLTGCEITSVSDESGINLKICSGRFTAHVPTKHISDIRLTYPERKFKIGNKVKGRVINVNKSNGRVYISLKKSIVTDQDNITLISDYDGASELLKNGTLTLATVESIRDNGCVVSFLGNLRGFLPKKEVSEAFVKFPKDFLRLGQTITVKVLDVDQSKRRVVVSCRFTSEDKLNKQKEIVDSMEIGRTIVDVIVVEKTKDSLIVELKDEPSIRGVLYVGHLSDSRIEQNRADIKKIKIGAELKGLVIDKDTRTKVFNITCKKSMIKDSINKTLPLSYDDVKSFGTNPMHGYIKSLSSTGIFVAFNGKFVGLVLPSYAAESRDIDLRKKFYVNQSITCYLLRTDEEKKRFLLTLREPKPEKSKASDSASSLSSSTLIGPIDPQIKTLNDLTIGKSTKCQVKQVKKNQLNVILAENIHGRIDVSEIFDSWDQIKNTNYPLSKYKKDDILDVKVIGYHDVKTHKYLPISHALSKNTIFELSTKSKEKLSTLNDIKVGDEVIGFVNNIGQNSLWLTINPQLKAKISLFDLTDSTNKIGNEESVEENYPLGSAIKCTVSSIDKEHQILNVSARINKIENAADVEVGKEYPARVIKVTSHYVLVDLGNNTSAISFITDALDDYKLTLPEFYSKNQVVSATIISKTTEDAESKINVSLRKTQNITSAKDLTVGQIVEGFIKTITDKGIFIYLARNLNAFVPVSKLTDSYIKDWKKFYKPMQLVTGKVVTCDNDKKIMLTLRESEVDGELKIMKSIKDIKPGDIFEGVVKNVTDFGVFIKLDNTINLTGLAHRNEVSDSALNKDLNQLFGPGDRIKAYVLKTNLEKNQVSLSLKASRFKVEDNKKDADTIDKEDDEDGDIIDIDYENESNDDDDDGEGAEEPQLSKKGPIPTSEDGLSLSAGFDWTANILDQAENYDDDDDDFSDNEDFTSDKKSKKKSKRKIAEDKSIDINTKAPESVADFERLILGNPNSSVIWMNYMAFELQLGEIDKGREIAERALKTINFREEMEKLNIWIAKLNLENTFGTDETLEDVFKSSCQYMDSYVMHMKLIGIFEASDKVEKALSLLKNAAKKFGSQKVQVWVNWGELLIDQGKTLDAHKVLANALKSLPKRDHIEIVRKFAQLEFKKGDPEQGRSLFEGLLADAPKRIDLWNVYIDQEVKVGSDKQKVEDLFERVFKNKKITRKQAKFFFKKWLEFEDSKGDEKAAEYVKAKAIDFVEKMGDKSQIKENEEEDVEMED
ncbi:related to rRNA biogenesis protein RRP5 [Saccharomycodes ludwigii]|uniref:Related to rRNA biogenesis protein RRP5 n=1 Tax=Saccharomycodes ludwigii TaxID=36035 RepID=A0A376B9N1_9ASCO|nr:hypothetical protein SCDLUD_005228 [Saccharomycodes ludwigii]KAH3898887.1 hypothetical protein SCDLUD_005228 [Saccharomycodes ludwigii]SSD61367.1 related to rRNA biogenesis protein RRP5 [Saccharomycodes ludwigii]